MQQQGRMMDVAVRSANVRHPPPSGPFSPLLMLIQSAVSAWEQRPLAAGATVRVFTLRAAQIRFHTTLSRIHVFVLYLPTDCGSQLLQDCSYSTFGKVKPPFSEPGQQSQRSGSALRGDLIESPPPVTFVVILHHHMTGKLRFF